MRLMNLDGFMWNIQWGWLERWLVVVVVVLLMGIGGGSFEGEWESLVIIC
ncbi:hypothetical protein Hanom_Chr07g00680321 [Helianthus anomalus]